MVNPAICATTAMLARLFYPYFELFFGTIYPAYASWKSMKNRDRHQYQRWMMYWVTYGSFQLIQLFTDMFLGFWFPFYYEIKVVFLIWLVSLNGHGAKLLFTYVINDELTKHEKAIDVYFDRVSGLGNEIIWRMWTECSKLAPKVISILLRLMIATSEGLPCFELSSSNRNNTDDALDITNTDIGASGRPGAYDEPPEIDDINAMSYIDSADSDAISTVSDDLIKSVRAARSKKSQPTQNRAMSMDCLERLVPMDCDIDKTLVNSHDLTPSPAKSRKQSKSRVTRGRKMPNLDDRPAEKKRYEDNNNDEEISDAAASDASVPSSPSKSKSRVLKRPRVLRRPPHYAPA